MRSRQGVSMVMAVALAVGILVVTHLRMGVIPGWFWFDGVDKVFHVSVSCLLTGILWVALDPGGRVRRIGLVAGVPMGLSALNELTQPWIGRACSLGDWFADSAGVALGIFICLFAYALRRSRSGRRP